MTKPRIAPDPRALQMVRIAIEASGTIKGAALYLGVERPTLSRYLNDPTYNCGPMNARILEKFSAVACPHKQRDVHPDECRAIAHAPRPVGGRARLALWTACQTCRHKPNQQSPHVPEEAA